MDEPRDEIGRREGYRAGGGQLDRQRDAVDAAADLLDVVPISDRVDARSGGTRPLGEQFGSWPDLERPHRHEVFAVDPERFP